MKVALISLFPFLKWLPRVTRESLRADLIAGITGAIIVFPQGIAFATIAGLPPEYGLYTAMAPPIIAALFGSSKHLISGPTTAISLVVFTAVSQYAEPASQQFIALAITLTFLAGVFQLASGLLRLGTLINFVSRTVVIGFTAGAAVLIATSQLKHVLGLNIPSSESFAHIWLQISHSFADIQYPVLIVATTTLAVAILTNYFRPQAPFLLIGMVAGSLMAALLGGKEAGLKMVGGIPNHLPPLSSPDLSIASVRNLASSAFAIALLGLIQSVSIARAIATKSHQRISASQEFIAQGLSNIVGSFFSCYAGAGSFTRSGVNYAAGARSALSAVFATLILILIVLLVAPLMAHLPNAAMGGVILVVAYGLIDFKGIRRIAQVSKSEIVILLITFFSTLFLEIEFAIYLGVLLSLMIYLKRTSMPEIAVLAPNPNLAKKKLTNVVHQALNQCPQLKIIRIDGTVYFGSANYVQRRLRRISGKEGIKHILIDSSIISLIDYAGATMLAEEAQRLKSIGGGLYLSTMRNRTYKFLRNGGFVDEIGHDHFFTSKTKAIEFIFAKLNRSVCSACTKRIFKECNK